MNAESINIEARIKILNSFLDKSAHRKAVTRELKAAQGDWVAASEVLKGKLPPETLQRLHVVDLVATAIGNKPEVINSILSHSDIKTARDVANLNVDELTERLAPEAEPKSEVYEQAYEHAIGINRQSFIREPLTVLQRMTMEGELPIADEKVRTGLATFLQRIPADTNLRITPIHKVLTEDALKDVPGEQRPAVIDQVKALWRILAVTPPDAPNVPQFLMKNKLTSAFLIAEKTESTFMRMCHQEKIEDETARQVYTNAINTRIRNENALMTMWEAIYGTGLAAIDGSKTREEYLSDVKLYLKKNDIQHILDAMFGDMDYCECKEY